jgi:hypothetical protein
MSRLVTIALVLAQFEPCARGEHKSARHQGPALLAASDDFALHAFSGAAQSRRGFDRVIQPGVVVFHTDLKTGKATWLIRTGTIEHGTRRVSFSFVRLLGLFQTDTHLVAVRYTSGRILDAPPKSPRPDKGSYRIEVIEKKSAKKLSSNDLDFPAGRPKQVPAETTGLGIIKPTTDGFTVLGNRFVVRADGRLKKHSSQTGASPPIE